MSRELCICLEFLTEAHKARIRETAAAAGFVPHFFTMDQLEEAKACVPRCEVLYAHSPDLLQAGTNLKWYCCSFAGVDGYCKHPELFPSPDCLLSNSNCYGVTIAEHVIMVTLMLLRQMPVYETAVRERRWISGWPHLLPIRSIRNGCFTVLGTGDIGSNVARRLRSMGAARITGLSRSGRAQEDFDQVLPISALDSVLPETAFLIMALPDTPETVHILNRQRLALLPREAYVVNVGRGSAIDQEALVDALEREALAGAALDVADPEPLPADHPLWGAKNLVLTPHVSGNMTLGYTCDANVELFCADLLNYAQGRPIQGLVDRARGY